MRNVEDAWLFVHMLFELIWNYRFLYRDLNDLLSKNRRLETHFQAVLQRHGTRRAGAARRPRARPSDGRLAGAKPTTVSNAMVVVLTYWLSYEYVRDPRHALEPESAAAALESRRLPCAEPAAARTSSPPRANTWMALAGAYQDNAAAG